MNYKAYLFLYNFPNIHQEIRTIDGKLQPCVILPTDSLGLKIGKRGHCYITLIVEELKPNERNQSHEFIFLHKKHNNKYEKLSVGRMYPLLRNLGRSQNTGLNIILTGTIILSDIPKKYILRSRSSGKRYVMNLTLRRFDDNYIYTGSVCIDDIPFEFIQTDPNTGKRFINTVLRIIDRMDSYANTHKLMLRTEDGQELEIGRFKEWRKERVDPAPAEQIPQGNNTEVKQSPQTFNGVRF